MTCNNKNPQKTLRHNIKITSHSPLTKQQIKIIECQASYIQVIAAAGSGKTHTVVKFVQNQLKNESTNKPKILVLSFSKKAVLELSNRLQAQHVSNIEISTFHSYCYRRILNKLNVVDKQYKLIIEEEKIAFIKSYVKSKPHRVGGIPFVLFSDKSRLKKFDPEFADELEEAFCNYKQQNNLLEFDDLILRLLEELKQESNFSKKLKLEFDLLIVDEFQDTDLLQLEFLKSIKPKKLLVVGDDYQAIYGFRGATVEPFLNFKKNFPGAKIHHLSKNFRSVKNIVCIGNKIIKQSSKQIKKRVSSNRENFRKKHIFSMALHTNDFLDLAKQINLSNQENIILVRTNYQRKKWIQIGLNPDQIMTVHKSKGLEFQNVILDITSGWNSVLRIDSSENQRDEEIRLHYVASSRAKDLLFILHKLDSKKECLENEYYFKLYKRHSKEIAISECMELIN